MHTTPDPTPDLAAVPGAKLMSGASLALLALLTGQLLTLPGVLGTVAGFALVFGLPALMVVAAVHAGRILCETLDGRRVDGPRSTDAPGVAASVDGAE